MNTLSKITATVLTTLAISSTAFAFQPQDDIPPQGQYQNKGQTYQKSQPHQRNQGQPQNAPQMKQQQSYQHGQGQRQNNQQMNQPYQHNQGQPQNNPQQSQPNFQVGKKLPQNYRGQGYRVNDYQSHNLPKPAKNQRWVNIDGQYLLVNILTNAIVQVLLNRY